MLEGQPRQTGILHGDLAERDLFAVAFRDFEIRQKVRDRCVERQAPGKLYSPSILSCVNTWFQVFE